MDGEESPTEKKDPCDHRPKQSEFFEKNGDLAKKVKSVMETGAMVLFLGVVLLASWINLEEGRFPYNISWVADVAYVNNKWGTPFFALVVTVVVGITLYFIRGAAISSVQDKCFKTVEDGLKQTGHVRKVEPKHHSES